MLNFIELRLLAIKRLPSGAFLFIVHIQEVVEHKAWVLFLFFELSPERAAGVAVAPARRLQHELVVLLPGVAVAVQPVLFHTGPLTLFFPLPY